ncbi:MAG: biosynthetic arginine decarboxylase [Deltaproteobacteria bacterium]|nr:MAG: biosynthetic arginine decarboxylase [Deltaproteobacteria bacterium]
MRPWTTADSAEIYNIEHWGADFLRIDDNGDLVIAPRGADGPSAPLPKLVEDLQRRGIDLPVLVRFTDMLRMRVETLARAFQNAFDSYEYRGRYRGVYPIKVNQQRDVVADLVAQGRPFHLGLEAGSKPELLLVMAMLDDPEARIICNGYKDEEYIATALMAQQLGRHPTIVVEKINEVDLIIRVARQMGVRPSIGLRAKLATRGSGRWEASSGDRAKFGLTAGELVDAVETLRSADMLDCLNLLHFHIGSQVSAIRSFKEALREASRLYVELTRLGAPMGMFDVGGGLGVDYDGSHSNFASSVNYTVQDYADDVVAHIEAACTEAGIEHPDIITESGRALVAHHSVLIVNVLGAIDNHPRTEAPPELLDTDPDILHELRETVETVSRKTYQSVWHDALEAREEVMTMFNLGLLDLPTRARADRLFWYAAHRVERIVRGLSYVPDEMQSLHRTLADTYFCNFSVFQSAPDAWAVDQLFPIMPIHRLDERPTRRAVLADITCDSDGKIDQFIDLHDVKDTLPLHPLDGRPYYLAFFLVGAYQEILGDLHNLFGDTNAVHVTLTGEGAYRVDHVVEGDTVSEVVGYVQYSRRNLLRSIRRAAEQAVQDGRLSLEDSGRIIREYVRGLEGYTYLE